MALSVSVRWFESVNSLATNRHIKTTAWAAHNTELFRRAPKTGMDCEIVYHSLFTILVTKIDGPRRDILG